MSGRTEIALYDIDRERLRELGSLLDRLDAALGDRDQIASILISARLAYLGGFCAGLADREPEEERATDPRSLGGAISGPGGPYDENAVVLDTRRATILEAVEVAVLGGIRKGVLDPKPITGMVLRGRINKTVERVQALYLLNEDGAAGIVTELVGVASRAGWGAEFTDLVKKRMEEMPL